MTLKTYGIFHAGKPCCPCDAEWIPAVNEELLEQGIITKPLTIAQLIGMASKSALVHSTGGAGDCWETDERIAFVMRQMGAVAWPRVTGSPDRRRARQFRAARRALPQADVAAGHRLAPRAAAVPPAGREAGDPPRAVGEVAALDQEEPARHRPAQGADEAMTARATRAGAVQEGATSDEPFGRLALFADSFGHGFCLVEFGPLGYDAIAEVTPRRS